MDNKCTCGKEDIEAHRCPYADDIYNEYKLPDEEVEFCKCCDKCTHQCAMDI